MTSSSSQLQVQHININELKASEFNPRTWSDHQLEKLRESIEKFGVVDPLIINTHPLRKNIVIGGNMRLQVLQEMKYTEVPVVELQLTERKERELNLRFNKTGGDWDYALLKEFYEDLLADVGFESEELDDVFSIEGTEEKASFDLKKELKKLDIKKITLQKGDVYQLGDSRLMCGDSTVEADFDKLMDGQKADMYMTDEPYILNYLHAKRGGKPVKGFGAKRDRIYLETESLPDNFIELLDGQCCQTRQARLQYHLVRKLEVPARNVECHGKVLKDQKYDRLASAEPTPGLFIKVQVFRSTTSQ